MDIFKNITGIGLTRQELYKRAFEKGVVLGEFGTAVRIFNEVAQKAAKAGDRLLEIQAETNAQIYHYLDKDKSNANLIAPLLQNLQNLAEIEEIGTTPTKMVSTAPLVAELDCRLVEFHIANAQDDITKLRDLHKDARDKFLKINHNLITYQYISAEGPDDKAENRRFYHSGMYHYYDAMIKKDVDPSDSTDNLAEAKKSFEQYNDPQWLPRVSELLDNWRQTRACWVCGREIQGYKLHFSMYPAEVTPYFKTLLEQEKKDSASVNVDDQQIAVCTACYSMIRAKAHEEADIVRQELNKKSEEALEKISSLESKVSDLESRVSHLEEQLSQI